MNLSSQKNGILFLDLDGTIADSGHGILSAMNHVLDARKLKPLSQEDLTHLVGPPLSVSFPILFEPRGVPANEMDLFISEYRDIYGRKYLPETPLNKGMHEALQVLGTQWYLAVVTSKPEKQALIAINSAGIRNQFFTVVGPQDDKNLPKARLLERALRESHDILGIAPTLKDCWMIGDRHHDIDAGQEVGTNSAGVLWGFGSHSELHDAGATAIVSDPTELVALLNR
jgi:phosphoglycolate phosphatase